MIEKSFTWKNLVPQVPGLHKNPGPLCQVVNQETNRNFVTTPNSEHELLKMPLLPVEYYYKGNFSWS